MFVLRIVLLVVHIASAAMIFAAPMGTTGSLRRALSSGNDEVLRSAAKDAALRGRLGGMGALSTLVTGLILIFVMGGFGAVRPQIHAALALMLAAIAFHVTFLRPALLRFGAAVSTSPPDRAVCENVIKRLAMGTGIGHLMWVVILVLMLHR